MRIAPGAGFFIFCLFLDQFLIFLIFVKNFVSSGMLISSGIMFFDVLNMLEASRNDSDEIWEKSFFSRKIWEGSILASRRNFGLVAGLSREKWPLPSRQLTI
mgnify:CR=1 FL=1